MRIKFMIRELPFEKAGFLYNTRHPIISIIDKGVGSIQRKNVIYFAISKLADGYISDGWRHYKVKKL